MRPLLFVLPVFACSGASSSPAAPASPTTTGDPVRDAALPDADVPEAVANAPAWIFRYKTPERTETWTLRTSDGRALVVVETAQRTIRYVGTANDGESLVVNVATSNAKLSLDCKHAKRGLSAKCNDSKAKPIEVLDCYHPDFKAPMPFGRDPGVEYVADSSCNGYRLISSDPARW
jgi:hypothetical protein